MINCYDEYLIKYVTKKSKLIIQHHHSFQTETYIHTYTHKYRK